MKQQSKKIIENLLSSVMDGTAEYSIIETDFRRVLFIESVSESNKFNMYAYCIKDDLLPYHNGVYHDSNRGCAVYTDGKILFYSRQYYDEEIHALFNIDGNYFTIAKIRKISLAMRDFGFEELAIPDDVKAGNPTLFTSEDSGVVVMPVVPMDYENDKSYYVVKL